MHDTPHRDPADSNEASYWPEYQDPAEDVFLDKLRELALASGQPMPAIFARIAVEAFLFAGNTNNADGARNAQREAVTAFLLQAREASSCPDLAYFVACWMLAFELDGTSQTDVAKEFGVTRAAVSKRVVEIRKAASGDNVARGQKSREAAKTYTLRQLIVGQTRKPAKLNQTAAATNAMWQGENTTMSRTAPKENL
jgi:predicted transcriptional regulator